MTKLINILFTSLLVFAIGCSTHNLPKETYYQFIFKKSHTFSGNELKIYLENPVMSPIRIYLQSSDSTLQISFNQINPITLEEKRDTTLIIKELYSFEDDIQYNIRLGSTEKEVVQSKIELPFPKGRSYKIIQGNNTSFTHNSDYSRYAIDFSLSIEDTISSATDGYVVGVIDQYKDGGKGKEWRPYSNFITIYNPQSGVFHQYVHLTHNGSFVEVGDKVSSGQPIALSGMTGQTDVSHLHFNSLVPVESNDGIKSIPVEFIEGYRGEDLKKNDIVKK